MVAASQGLFFISSPHEGGNQNLFLKCHVFETMFMNKEEKEMIIIIIILMINQHNDRCKRVRK
jgi:hypothetical protein